MSKVVIQGNASGTGNFTIAAPNSNTDRTFNLPDATGTVDRLERAGNVLQVATDTLEGVISGSYTTGAPSTITNGVEVFSLSFTPISASSTILVMTSTVALSEDANAGDVWWLALWDGSTFVASNSGTWGYNNFANFRNAVYQSLCHTYSAGSTSARTISVRAGLNGGTTIHQYVNGNAYSNYTGSSARIQMTVMEIAG